MQILNYNNSMDYFVNNTVITYNPSGKLLLFRFVKIHRKIEKRVNFSDFLSINFLIRIIL